MSWSNIFARRSRPQEPAMTATRPLGVVFIAIFFAAATVILVCAGAALSFPGSRLDAIWSLYPERRALLMPYRAWLGPGFLALAIAMAAASAGCFRRRGWGWRLAVAIFAVNGLGDLTQLVMGRVLEGGVGVAVAGAILFYLTRANVRKAFA
jgi:hypothetical protein